ncbi:MAG: hypothetical protein KBB01_04115 [Candidatus Omnitrophica bacterium]|jgi:hypothetical protein|nr:hypothetical protein [Candidatus Omnitrophota bacterium]
MKGIISIETGLAMLSIFVTTWVAIYSIRKTAEANRVSTVHSEMVKCVIDSIVKMRMTRKLLNAVANKVYYYLIPEDNLIESAYKRYWREIKTISTAFNVIQARQMFVFPQRLYKRMQSFIKKANEAREEAKYYNPESNSFTPGNNKLNEIVKEMNSIYVDFVNDARLYISADAISPISVKNEEILKVEETKES